MCLFKGLGPSVRSLKPRANLRKRAAFRSPSGRRNMDQITELNEITKIEIEAIISSVRRDVKYQSRVSRIMRTISEAIHGYRHYGSTGKSYRDSSNAKRVNPFISREAAALLPKMTFREFKRAVDLEHALPLREAYRSLRETVGDITRQNVIDCLRRYPLVTITKEEHKRLRGLTDPNSRYIQADVEVGRVDKIAFGVAANSWRLVSLEGNLD
jgi:hypothetical protein